MTGIRNAFATTPLTLLCTLTLALAGCGGGGGGGDDTADTTAPTVTSTTPAADAASVAPGSDVEATFSEAMNCTTITSASFTLANAGATAIEGNVTCSGGSASFAPTLGLPEGETVSAAITTAVTDSAGNAIAADYSWSFTTRTRAWGTAGPVESTATELLSPQLAVAPDGTAIAVWRDNASPMNIWATRYAPDSGWSTPEIIDDTGDANDAYDPLVFMDTNGNAFVVWNQWEGDDRIWVRRFTAGAGWETIERLQTSGQDGLHPHIAFDADGNAMAVWDAWDGTHTNVWSRYYTAGGNWGDPVLVESDTTGADKKATVAFAGDGTAVAIWDRYAGARDNLWAAVYTTGTGWAAPVALESDDIGGAFAAPIAADPAGNLMVVWRQFDGTDYPVWSRRYLPGSGWQDAQQVSDGAGVSTVDPLPRVAFDAQGNAMAVWSQVVGTARDVMANHFSVADGSWATAEAIDTANDLNVSSTRVVMDARGNAVALWVQSSSQLVANRYTAGSGWGGGATIGSSGAVVISHPAVELTARGDAMAVWSLNNSDVMFNRFE